jgi:hypothetical protein
LEREVEELMELYSYQAREGLDLYTPQDGHDAYKTLGIRVIAHSDGSTELTGGLLAELHSDNKFMIPFERIESLHPMLRFRVLLGGDAHDFEVLR